LQTFVHGGANGDTKPELINAESCTDGSNEQKSDFYKYRFIVASDGQIHDNATALSTTLWQADCLNPTTNDMA
jgi:hypothetical protein